MLVYVSVYSSDIKRSSRAEQQLLPPPVWAGMDRVLWDVSLFFSFFSPPRINRDHALLKLNVSQVAFFPSHGYKETETETAESTPLVRPSRVQTSLWDKL